MDSKKKIVITIISILLVLVLIIGISYALEIFKESSADNTIKTGKISMSYTESSNVISINNALPVTDEVGKAQTNYFEFNVSSKADTNSDDSEGIKIPYSLIIEPKTIDADKDSFLTSDIKVYLTKVNGSSEKNVIGPIKLSELTSIDTNFNLYNTSNVHKNGNGMVSTKYRLRAWIDYGVDTSSWSEGSKQKQYKFAVNVNAMGEQSVSLKAAQFADAKLGTGGLVADSHPATEQMAATTDYRYTGANPDNYVSFNNELWRIIGIFDVDNGTGKLEKRIKLIRKDSLGDISWDYPGTRAPANNWESSTAMTLLNSGDYWNRTGDYASTGLTLEAKSLINSVKWYLGGFNYDDYQKVNSLQLYSYERSMAVYSGNPTSWVGKVGLMYPSDYGYATSGNVGDDRDTCLSTEIYNWNNSSVTSNCKTNDWLYDNSKTEWTIIPNSMYTCCAFTVLSSGAGFISQDNCGITHILRPSLYLSSDVFISGGNGTSMFPYTLSK